MPARLLVRAGHTHRSTRNHKPVLLRSRSSRGDITEELVRRGHDVTLFAAGDAQTSARLHPACPQALRLVGKQELGAFLQMPMLSDVYDNADDFDVIHGHIDYWTFPFARLSRTPSITTM